MTPRPVQTPSLVAGDAAGGAVVRTPDRRRRVHRRERPAIEGGRPVRDTYLTFGEPLIGEEEIAEVVDTLRSGWIGTGPKVQRFEERFRDYVGVPHAVGVSSCTAALELALEVLGVGRGDEVITSPMTFAATANVIVHRGAVPVFADIDPATLNIDPDEVRRRVTPRTRAIVPVHIAGRPCEMDEIVAIARAHGAAVVSDAAHAIEARFGGRSVAALGDMAAFSFYVTKNITTCEGGMLTTAEAAWAEEARQRALHGLTRDAWNRYAADGSPTYEAVYPGHKFNLTDLNASLGLHQLARIEERWARRDRHSQRYREALAHVPGILLPRDGDLRDGRHARHLFVVLLDLEMLGVTRDEFVAAVAAENVGCGVHFTPVHLHAYYRETYGFRPGDAPHAEWVGERTLSLPLSAGLSEADVDDVIAAVRKVAHHLTRA